MATKRELLFSVTAKDCEWEYFRGSGKGGQKRNKTSNGVRCQHIASGAVGRATDGRSQRHNKELAFRRMFETKEFQRWIKIRVAQIAGEETEARRYADREISSGKNIRIEVKKDGKWTEENIREEN